MLRGQGEFWVQNQGALYGGTATARHSDTVNYAGGALGHAPPSTEYVMNVSYGANAAMQAQPDGGGDQLGPLPTQVGPVFVVQSRLKLGRWRQQRRHPACPCWAAKLKVSLLRSVWHC